MNHIPCLQTSGHRSTDAAADVAQRIRPAVSKQLFRVGEGVAARTSCSIGFSVFPLIPGARDRGSFEESLAVAYAALYGAKTQRRRRELS